MKHIYFFFLLFCLGAFKAQNPCSGTPGSNTVLPLSQTICAGTSINLSLANNYSNTGITFQWQSSTTSSVGPFTNINGATTKAFATPTLGGNLFFNVVITCTNSGLTISVPYSITVVPCNTPCAGSPANSSITPATQTVCMSNVAALGLSNSYTQTGISYQWASSLNSSGPFTAINGATMSSYVSNTVNSTTYYNVVITCTNSNLSYTTGTATLSAVSCTFCSGAPPSNTILPSTSTICAGSNLTLSLANTYSTSGITYQWQNSSVSQVGPFQPISGANASTLLTSNLVNNTYYNLVITCTNSGQSISINKTLNVVACNQPCTGTPQASSILPISNTICAGANTTLSLSSTYTATGITFQWGSAAVSGGTFSAINGATNSAYATPTLGGTSYYNVIITCTNSNLSYNTSHTVSVISCSYCSGLPSSNTILPVSPTICAGSNLQLSLANSYTASGITYQWQSSSVSQVGPFQSISGANASSFITPSLSNTMYYNVVITCTNSGQSISVPVTVYVMPCPGLCTGTPASNTVVPLSHTLCAGSQATMGLAYTYTETGLTYQWYIGNAAGTSNTLLPGAVQPTLTSTVLNNTSYFNLVITCTASGLSYTVSHVVSVVNCSVTSGAIQTLPDFNAIILFPNPNQGSFTIKTGMSDTKQIEIKDLLGKTVYRLTSNDPNIEIALSDLSNGLYLVHIEMNGLVKVIQLKKE